MKKILRERALAELYAGLLDWDFDEREYAIFRLSLILQRSQADAADRHAPDFYGENLTRDLLRIRMSTAEQREAAEALAQVMADFPKSRPSALWACSQLSTEIGLPLALAKAREYGGQLGDEAAYQVCRALAHWLTSGGLTQQFIDMQLDGAGRLRCVERWSDSADARLAQAARRLRRIFKSTGG